MITHSILAGYSRKSMVSVRHSTERIWKNLLENEKDSLIQTFLPVEMYLTYQVDGEPLEQLPNGYSDHYVPDGFERDHEQEFEKAENFLHVYSSKESGKGYTVRCSIIQPGQQSSFDNEHTTYENVKVGDADATLGTSVEKNGDTVYILSWEQRGISNTIMGNISQDEIARIAENIFNMSLHVIC